MRDHLLNGRGDREALDVGRCPRSEQFRELHHEQRVPAGVISNAGGKVTVRGMARRGVDQITDLVLVESQQGDRARDAQHLRQDVGQRQARIQIGIAVGAHEGDRLVALRCCQKSQEVQRCGISKVKILQHDHDRPRCCGCGQEGRDALEEAQSELVVGLVDHLRAPEEGGEIITDLETNWRRRSRVDTVVHGKNGGVPGSFQLVPLRSECREGAGELVDEPCLADSGLTRDYYEPTRARQAASISFLSLHWLALPSDQRPDRRWVSARPWCASVQLFTM